MIATINTTTCSMKPSTEKGSNITCRPWTNYLTRMSSFQKKGLVFRRDPWPLFSNFKRDDGYMANVLRRQMHVPALLSLHPSSKPIWYEVEVPPTAIHVYRTRKGQPYRISHLASVRDLRWHGCSALTIGLIFETINKICGTYSKMASSELINFQAQTFHIWRIQCTQKGYQYS